MKTNEELYQDLCRISGDLEKSINELDKRQTLEAKEFSSKNYLEDARFFLISAIDRLGDTIEFVTGDD